MPSALLMLGQIEHTRCSIYE
uniref:Uncharacterized protein n=1 Tax=Arundo donax TaxID=35708 RepID=A0A0A9FWQ0_ARUDO